MRNKKKKGRDTPGICENILSTFRAALERLICTLIQMRKKKLFYALNYYCSVLRTERNAACI